MGSPLVEEFPVAAACAAVVGLLSLVMMSTFYCSQFSGPRSVCSRLRTPAFYCLRRLLLELVPLFWEVFASAQQHLLANQSRLSYIFHAAELIFSLHGCCGAVKE
jgi:hypothetical protein